MDPSIVLLVLRLLMAAALYAFLGGVFFALWRDLRVASAVGEACPPAQLAVLEGPLCGRRFALGDLNSMGRAADNTVCLQDETVSAYHARLSFQAGQWWLEDVGSRNGTRLNDLPVDQPLVITYGDSIHLGRVRLRLEAASTPGQDS